MNAMKKILADSVLHRKNIWQKNRKILYQIICVLICTLIAMGLSGNREVKAADNPYPSTQNVDGDAHYEVPCTWFVWQHIYNNLGIALPQWGNGGQWLSNAANSGYSTGNVALPNSIAVWQDSGYGHVAFVSSVSGGNMTIAEGGRTDLDHTASHGVCYDFSISSAVGSLRSNGNQKLIGFIYLNGYRQPEGCVDSVTAGKGKITVGGWAFDRDAANTSLKIHVYIGGPAGTQGAECHVITANSERKDVNNVYGVGNYHGFHATIQTSKSGNQPVYIYAINAGVDVGNPCIGSRNVSIGKSYNPEGCFDTATGGTQSVRVTGWAFDRDSTNTSLQIHVYIGGPAGTKGAECHGISANTIRTDVNKVYGFGKYHGFDSTISTNKIGLQTIYVYAINVDGGNNVLLGSKTVTIKESLTPKKVSGLSAKSTKSQIAILSWTGLYGVTGYELSYARNSLFIGGKTAQVKGNTVNLTRLAKKKTYYFKVRAYKKSGEKIYYGSWSDKVKCTIK